MNSWILRNYRNLSEGSTSSNNNGQTPITAKYEKTFVNIETGEVRSRTDLQTKMYKRDICVESFFTVYKEYYGKKTHSILCAVVNQDQYNSITKFINTITRKFKRKGIDILGYVWVRDIGDKIFHKHYHVIFATPLINAALFKEIFCNKKHNHYDIQFLKTLKGMAKYIKDKDLFGAKKQRSFGKSRLFSIKKVPKSKFKRANANLFI
jgi:hypothetical protein